MSLLRKILLILWLVITLGVLVFIFSQIQNVINAPSKFLSETLGINNFPQSALDTQNLFSSGNNRVVVYFINLNSMCLEKVDIDIENGESYESTCRNVISAMKEHQSEMTLSPLPKDSTIRGIYLLDDGEVVIDLPSIIFKDIPLPKTALAEMLWVYSLVNTLLQEKLYKDIKLSKLRILIEGSEPSLDFFGHIDITSPFSPDYSLVCNANL